MLVKEKGRVSGRLFKIVALSIFLSVMSFGAVVQAETRDEIAVVDVQQILSEAQAAQDIQKQIADLRKKFQDEFSAQESKLRVKEQEIAQKRKDMTDDEFNEARLAFESDLLKTRQLVQKRRQSLEKAANEALVKLKAEIVKVVAELSDKEGYALVITRQNVVLAEKDMDVTDKVMARLNERVSTIKVDVKN